MKRLLTSLICLLTLVGLYAQNEGVGINATGSNPDASAILDVQSSEKGFLMPRMTSAERDAITAPAAGLYIYNLNDSCFNYYTGQEWVKDCGRTFGRDYTDIAPKGWGSTSYDDSYDVTTDAAGNIYLTGFFEGEITFGNITLSTGSNQRDVFVVKFDPSGKVVWAFNEGGAFDDQGSAIAVDGAGNVYVAGIFEGTTNIGGANMTANGGPNIFFAKYSPTGQPMWGRSYGGPNIEGCNGLVADAAGNCFLVGEFSSSTIQFGSFSLSTSTKDMYVAKIDSNGQVTWAIQGNATGYYTNGRGVAIDIAGNVYVAGNFGAGLNLGGIPLSPGGIRNIFVSKLDSNGQAIWAQKADGSSFDAGTGVGVDVQGNVYVSGYITGTTDFGGGNIFTANGSADPVLAKYSSTGQLQWVVHEGGPSSAGVWDMSADETGNSFITGSFSDSLTLGSTTLYSQEDGDVFIAKYDSSGQLLWASEANGLSYDTPRGITADPNGNVYVTGQYANTLTFGGESLSSTGFSDIFLLSLDGTTGQNLTQENNNLANSQDLDMDPNNEIQTLSLNGNQLALSGANSQDLSGINTDNQTLSLNGNQLSISGGNTQDLSSLNTDSQTLILAGTQLSISGGNSQDLAPLQDNLGNHTATQNVQLGSQYLSGDGDNEGIRVDTTGNVGLGTTTPDTTLHVVGKMKYQDGNQQDGYVLKSDAQGVASWQAAGDTIWGITPGKSIYNLGGNHIVTGPNSLVMGTDNTVSADRGLAVGNLNLVDGFYSVALGSRHRITVNTGFAFGANDTLANFASGSFAFGQGNYLNSGSSGAFGVENRILNFTGPSFALGLRNEIRGASSVAIGRNLELAGNEEYVIGTYNDPWVAGNPDRLFTIGNGTFSSRSNAFTVLKSGNVGIGTSNPNPSALLEVNSTEKGILIPRMSSTERQAIANPAEGLMVYDNTTSSFWYFSTNWQEIGDNLGNHTASQNLQLGSYFLSGDGDSEGIYISNSGDVGIGTSTPGSFRLNVEGAIQFGGFSTTDQNEAFKAVWLQDPATNWDEYLLKVASTQGSGMFNRPGFGIHMDGTKQFGFWSSGFNQLFTVNGGSGDTYIKGSVGIGSTSPGFKLQVGENADGTVARANAWTTWSDSTLKRDFQELPDALQMLSQINGYYYHWKEGAADSSRQVGVMAQEIERVLPELISTDAEGIMAVDYDKLTALLIEVNQAQEEKITAQQSEIGALRAENAEMKASFEARLQALEAALSSPTPEQAAVSPR